MAEKPVGLLDKLNRAKETYTVDGKIGDINEAQNTVFDTVSDAIRNPAHAVGESSIASSMKSPLRPNELDFMQNIDTPATPKTEDERRAEARRDNDFISYTITEGISLNKANTLSEYEKYLKGHPKAEQTSQPESSQIAGQIKTYGVDLMKPVEGETLSANEFRLKQRRENLENLARRRGATVVNGKGRSF